MTDTRTANPIQIAALESFAAHHGRKWKSTLNVYWYNARLWRGPKGDDDTVGAILHGIRNQFGPTWLDTFKLPKQGA